jgi:Putative polyhydroxyalkanoic acid system protein (PHA_gran_rgn)
MSMMAAVLLAATTGAYAQNPGTDSPGPDQRTNAATQAKPEGGRVGATGAGRFNQTFSPNDKQRLDGQGDRLQFRIVAVGQSAAGTIDIAEDHARLEVTLPWLLAQVADKIQRAVQKQGKLMLDKK